MALSDEDGSIFRLMIYGIWAIFSPMIGTAQLSFFFCNPDPRSPDIKKLQGYLLQQVHIKRFKKLHLPFSNIELILSKL